MESRLFKINQGRGRLLKGISCSKGLVATKKEQQYYVRQLGVVSFCQLVAVGLLANVSRLDAEIEPYPTFVLLSKSASHLDLLQEAKEE